MRRFVYAARATYFGNATVTRDFRTQLRGMRSFWLWLGYLLFLIVFGGFAYSSMVESRPDYYSYGAYGGGGSSVSALQGKLYEFYGVIVAMIAGVICLVAPGLTASAVTVERQRRSLDLVFSAPVSPRYFLVGKLISGLRYLVLLLVLALPVISVCVVMGGATWVDVIGAVVILLSAGIVMMSIGLLCSAVAPNSITAILGSYLAIVIYQVAALAMAGPGLMGGMGMRTGGAAPWTVVVSPFSAILAAPTHTMLFGVQVPNWVLGVAYSLVFAKMMLVAAGAALSPPNSNEVRSLRIHGLIACASIGWLVASAVSPSMSIASAASSSFGSSSPAPRIDLGLTVSYLVSVIFSMTFLLWPQIICFGGDAGRKFADDGVFSLKGIFNGTPSGSLGYLLSMFLCLALGMLLVFELGILLDPRVLASGFWVTSFAALWWGVGRYISARSKSVRNARLGLFTAILLIVAIPVPIITVLSEAQRMNDPSFSQDTWMRFHIAYPLYAHDSEPKIIYGVICLILGALFALMAYNRTHSQKSQVNFNV